MRRGIKILQNNKENEVQKQLSDDTAGACTGNRLTQHEGHSRAGKAPGLGHKRLYFKSQLYN